MGLQEERVKLRIFFRGSKGSSLLLSTMVLLVLSVFASALLCSARKKLEYEEHRFSVVKELCNKNETD